MAEKDVNLWSINGKTPEAKIAALEKENQALGERIAELERRLGIDSNNSLLGGQSSGKAGDRDS